MKSIGIDIGASFIKAAVIDKKGKVLYQENVAHLAKNPHDLIIKTATLINNLKNIYCGKTLAIGVAGIIDSKKGIIKYSPNLKKWKNIKFLAALKKRVKIKILMENDANMSAWGAYAYGLKKKYKNILTVTLGTGVGGGIIIDGKLYKGATLNAGEIGHTKINFLQPLLCSCGDRDCIESMIGSRAILKLAKQLLKTYKTRTFLTQKNISLENLNLAAQKKDPLALKLWRQVGFYLGNAIANAVLILNPEIVMISGGPVKASRFFMPELKKVLKKQKIKTPFKNLKIRVSTNPALGAIGAALYAADKSK